MTLILPLAFLLAASAGAAPTRGGGTAPCLRELTPSYSPSDFRPSTLWVGARSSDEAFSAWASEAANAVAEGLGAAETIEDLDALFARVSHGRRELQKLLGDEGLITRDAIRKFGTLRDINVRAPRTTLGFLPGSKGEGPIWGTQEREKLVRRVISLNTDSLLSNEFPYVLLDGTIIVDGAALTVWSSGRVDLQHPADREAVRMFADVKARILELLKAPSPEAFLVAMHGFYQAMPYYRGSAAIGRAFFSGLHLHLFGAKLVADPEIDAIAIGTSREVFVDQFRAQAGPSPRSGE